MKAKARIAKSVNSSNANRRGRVGGMFTGEVAVHGDPERDALAPAGSVSVMKTMETESLLLYYNCNNKMNMYCMPGKGIAMTDDGIVSCAVSADDTKITTRPRCGVATELFRATPIVTARADMPRRNLFARSLILFAACGIAVNAGGARADTVAASTSADTELLETITVTARKRDESLATVPVSITVFTAEALENYNIQSFTDYATKTPNVSFSSPIRVPSAFRASVSKRVHAFWVLRPGMSHSAACTRKRSPAPLTDSSRPTTAIPAIA
jgi:hypothetical protein